MLRNESPALGRINFHPLPDAKILERLGLNLSAAQSTITALLFHPSNQENRFRSIPAISRLRRIFTLTLVTSFWTREGAPPPLLGVDFISGLSPQIPPPS